MTLRLAILAYSKVDDLINSLIIVVFFFLFVF